MSVASWLLSKWTGAGQQDPSTYKGAIDGNFAVAQQIVSAFAPQQQAAANMTIQVLAGNVLDGGSLVINAAQSTGTITAPVTYPRIDRMVIDQRTGAISVVAGTENATPVAPAIPAGKLPCAQILLQTTSTVITNSMITDERTLSSISKAYADATYLGIGATAVAVSGSAVVTGAVQSGTNPKFMATLYRYGQGFTSGVAAKILFGQKLFDVGGYFDNVTNYRFQPLVAGYYQLNWSVGCDTTIGLSITDAQVFLYKNGGQFLRSGRNSDGGTTYFTSSGGCVVQFNGSTDYAEIWAQITGTSPSVDAGGYTSPFVYPTYFSGALVP